MTNFNMCDMFCSKCLEHRPIFCVTNIAGIVAKQKCQTWKHLYKRMKFDAFLTKFPILALALGPRSISFIDITCRGLQVLFSTI